MYANEYIHHNNPKFNGGLMAAKTGIRNYTTLFYEDVTT